MAVYTLKILTDFAAAHTLRNYPGACSRMHGHNWKVEVEVRASTLNNSGMVLDFKEIKQQTRNVTDKLDHQYLNEVLPFDTINPTAENIAAYIFEQVSKAINSADINVYSVTLWETDRACVRYQETE
jgi:6-pyruvoyltetrahydropterin/6-carboxytetrahydropterin synthase